MRVNWNGMDDIVNQIRTNAELELAKKIVKVNSAELDQTMKARAVFVKGYSTGQTRRTIETEITDGGLTTTTRPTTEYSPYLEYGTRHMEAQPFVKPAFNRQKELFKRDMDRLVK